MSTSAPPPDGAPSSGATERPPRTALVRVYVALIGLAAAGAAALTLSRSGSPDWSALAVGCALGFILELPAARLVPGTPTSWSASGFIHLSVTLALGPPGALAVATGAEAALWARLRDSPIKVVFNTSLFLLANLAAWQVFLWIPGSGESSWAGALAAVVAAAARMVVSTVLLGVVVILATPGAGWRRTVRGSLTWAPFILGFGWAAYGSVLLYRMARALGLTFLAVPVVLLDVFLLLYERRRDAESREREERLADAATHARDRLSLAEHALDASNAERARIAGELHDTVVQDLAAISLRLSRQAESAPPDDATVMRRAAQTATEAMGQLRTLITEIAPPDLHEVGLAEALRDLVPAICGDAMDADITVDSAVDRVVAAPLIFRAVQEALRNVAKHAAASRVEIGAEPAGEMVDVTVRDNGRGFDDETQRRREREGHMGLRLLTELVRSRGGTLDVRSVPGEGTTVHVRIPRGSEAS